MEPKAGQRNRRQVLYRTNWSLLQSHAESGDTAHRIQAVIDAQKTNEYFIASLGYSDASGAFEAFMRAAAECRVEIRPRFRRAISIRNQLNHRWRQTELPTFSSLVSIDEARLVVEEHQTYHDAIVAAVRRRADIDLVPSDGGQVSGPPNAQRMRVEELVIGMANGGPLQEPLPEWATTLASCLATAGLLLCEIRVAIGYSTSADAMAYARAVRTPRTDEFGDVDRFVLDGRRSGLSDEVMSERVDRELAWSQMRVAHMIHQGLLGALPSVSLNGQEVSVLAAWTWLESLVLKYPVQGANAREWWNREVRAMIDRVYASTSTSMATIYCEGGTGQFHGPYVLRLRSGLLMPARILSGA